MEFSPKDKEHIMMANHTVNLLVSDLRELVKADNPLLGELAIEVLEEAVKIEQRLKRINTLTMV